MSRFSMFDAAGGHRAAWSGGASRFLLHLMTVFSQFRSDGVAVAAELGKEGFLGGPLCSSERKNPPDQAARRWH